MAVINIIVPKIGRRKFSGGMLCALEYARGLRLRNHVVNIIPLLPSENPEWFGGDIGYLPKTTLLKRVGQVFTTAYQVLHALFAKSHGKSTLLARVREFTTAIAMVRPELFSHNIQRALSLTYTKSILGQMSPADVTLATSHETVLPAHLYGTGRRYYFAMHYEPYFSIDSPEPELALYEAQSALEIDIGIIANSSWLKRTLKELAGREVVALCPNAIDHSIFFGAPKLAPLGKEVKIISYGGRNAQWKGIAEMAEGMRLVRQRFPDRSIRWLVYGPCMLPPDNGIASYEALGFLSSRELAQAYRQADILLSASWYESFPLFPLEAMACGIPVITTQEGTEEFAKPQETAEVVKTKDAEEIATAIIRLITQEEHRTSLAKRGNEIAKLFTWQSAVSRLENILLGQTS